MRTTTQTTVCLDIKLRAHITNLIWVVLVVFIRVSQDLVLDTLAVEISVRQGTQSSERKDLYCVRRLDAAGRHPTTFQQAFMNVCLSGWLVAHGGVYYSLHFAQAA